MSVSVCTGLTVSGSGSNCDYLCLGLTVFILSVSAFVFSELRESSSTKRYILKEEENEEERRNRKF